MSRPNNQPITPYEQLFGRRHIEAEASVSRIDTSVDWEQTIMRASMSRYEWLDVPYGLDTRWLEWLLYMDGFCAITFDLGKVIAGRVCGIGGARLILDEQANYQDIMVSTINCRMLSRHCQPWHDEDGFGHKPNAIVIYDNLDRMICHDMTRRYAARLARMDMVYDQHVMAQMQPYIVQVPEEGKEGAERYMRKLWRGEPVVYGAPTVSQVYGMQVMQTGAPYNGDKILQDEARVLSQVLTRLGIDSNPDPKRERVQTQETLSNNEQTMVFRRSYTAARKQGVAQLNEWFGCAADVIWGIPHDFADAPMGGGEADAQ